MNRLGAEEAAGARIVVRQAVETDILHRVTAEDAHADFAAVLAKAESLRADYDVTVLPQAKKLGKQFGTLEAAGYNAVAFADNDDVKLLGQKAE